MCIMDKDMKNNALHNSSVMPMMMGMMMNMMMSGFTRGGFGMRLMR